MKKRWLLVAAASMGLMLLTQCGPPRYPSPTPMPHPYPMSFSH